MIIGGVIAGIVLIYLGISAYFIGHFYVNTQINGKDFSGKNAEAVKKYIKEQVDGYELKIIEQNQQTDVIRGTDISLEWIHPESTGRTESAALAESIFLQEFNGCYCGGRF